MIKYSAKEYFFRASLCHLCVDAVNAQHAIQRYEEQFPAFGDSRECKLVKVGRSVSQFDHKSLLFQITKVVNIWVQNIPRIVPNYLVLWWQISINTYLSKQMRIFTNLLVWVTADQILDSAFLSRKCSIDVPDECRIYVYVLTEICLQWCTYLIDCTLDYLNVCLHISRYQNKTCYIYWYGFINTDFKNYV